MKVYIKFGNIEGDVAMPGFEKFFEASTVSYGVDRSFNNTTGSVSQTRFGLPTARLLEVSKPISGVDADLLKAALDDKACDVTVCFVKSIGGKPEKFKEITFKNAGIAYFDTTVDARGSDDILPLVNIGINFTEMEMAVTATDGLNAAASPKRAGYNFKDAKAVA